MYPPAYRVCEFKIHISENFESHFEKKAQQCTKLNEKQVIYLFIGNPKLSNAKRTQLNFEQPHMCERRPGDG